MKNSGTYDVAHALKGSEKIRMGVAEVMMGAGFGRLSGIAEAAENKRGIPYPFWKCCLFHTILIFACYGVMMAQRFSTDSYSVFFYDSSSINMFLPTGRIGNYILFRILLALGINTVAWSQFFTAVFCICVAWAVTVLLYMAASYFRNLDWKTLLAVDLSIVAAFVNMFFAELFFFSDVALVYTFNIFFVIVSLWLFIRERPSKGTDMTLSFLCLALSLSFYQATIEIFVLWGLLLILLKYDILWRVDRAGIKRVLREGLLLVIVGGSASVANILSQKIAALLGAQAGRSASLSLMGIISSIKQIFLYEQIYYDWGYPRYLSGVLKIVCCTAGPVLALTALLSFQKASRRENHPAIPIMWTALAFVMSFLCVFAPHYLSEEVWLTPRSIYVFCSLLSFAGIVGAYNQNRCQKGVPWASLIMLIGFLAANVFVIYRIGMNQLDLNLADKIQAEEIVQVIRSYEAESGTEVDTISWRSDGNTTWTYPWVKYSFMDMNVRADARSWSLGDCISYYAGKHYAVEKMPQEIYETYFFGCRWDIFEPGEQIRFEGNKMYYMVY